MQFSGMFAALGNPGNEYGFTRHNFGFMLADYMLSEIEHSGSDKAEKLSFGKKNCEAWKLLFTDSPLPWLLIKPMTYMNNSGIPTQAAAAFYNITPKNIIVLHDELDLPLGSMRFKFGGSAAGHNGIKSITQQFGGDNNFYRLRLGIGKTSQSQTIGHVLGHFSKADIPVIESMLQAGVEGLKIFRQLGFTPAQQYINSFKFSSKT